jgi:hypothetical protein
MSFPLIEAYTRAGFLCHRNHKRNGKTPAGREKCRGFSNLTSKSSSFAQKSANFDHERNLQGISQILPKLFSIRDLRLIGPLRTTPAGNLQGIFPRVGDLGGWDAKLRQQELALPFIHGTKSPLLAGTITLSPDLKTPLGGEVPPIAERRRT